MNNLIKGRVLSGVKCSPSLKINSMTADTAVGIKSQLKFAVLVISTTLAISGSRILSDNEFMRKFEV